MGTRSEKAVCLYGPSFRCRLPWKDAVFSKQILTSDVGIMTRVRLSHDVLYVRHAEHSRSADAERDLAERDFSMGSFQLEEQMIITVP
jgi:hypothetical protein